MDFNRITQEEREKLYNEVWNDPVTIVAQRYNMSDNGLRKHLKRLWIPLPTAGYWAKVKAGQKVYKPDLPKVRGELKRYVYQYAIKYRHDIDQITDEELSNSEALSLLTDDTISFINETCSEIQVKSQLRNPHDLIIKHKEESAYRKKRDKDLNQASFNTNYYNITKSKYRRNEAMLPINVSDENLNRVYRILDALMYTIEDMEGYTSVGLVSEKDKAAFVIIRTFFYFEMKEEKPKKQRSVTEEETPPHLVLSLLAENWYYNRIQKSLEYKDKKDDPLENKVGNIILDMFKTADKMGIEEEIEKREDDRLEKERERQRRLEQMRRGELEEMKFLEQAVSDWNKAQGIKNFANHMELKLSDVTDDEKRNQLIEWLIWARHKADWLDPLTAKEDELLGKNKHIFEIILGLK